MRSRVAEELRREQIEETKKMSISERVSLAFELGERDLQFLMAFQKLDRESAVRAMRREHQNGRRYSRCMDESS